jgi:hypothetical protein
VSAELATLAGTQEEQLTSTFKALIALAFLASFFAPPLALAFAVVLILGTAYKARPLLPFAILAYAHAGAVIFASRDFSAASADFLKYFGIYESIVRGSGEQLEDALLEFGPEIGLPGLYLAFRLLGLGGLSINGLAYVQTLLTSAAILVMLARHVFREREGGDNALVIVGACLVYSFFFSTQLSRQVLSSVFLLNAIHCEGDRKRTALWVLLGTAFHVSAPFLFLLVILLRTSNRSAMIVVLVGAGSALLIEYVVPLLIAEGLASLPLASKLFFYADVDASFVLSDWQSVGYLAVAGAAGLAHSIKTRSGWGEVRFLVGTAVITSVLLPLPLAATRFSLPFASLLGGYYLFRTVGRTSRHLAIVGVVLVGVYRLTTIVAGGGSEHGLWLSYPMYGALPGYYWDHFIARW